MSFEPQLLINYTDLINHKNHISASAESGLANKRGKPDDIRAYAALKEALNYPVVIFPERQGLTGERGYELRLVLIHPELTSHNKRVRELLDMLEIEYKTIN